MSDNVRTSFIIHVPDPRSHVSVLVGLRPLPMSLVTLPFSLVFRAIMIVHHPDSLLTVINPRPIEPIPVRIQHHALPIEMPIGELTHIHGSILPD